MTDMEREKKIEQMMLDELETSLSGFVYRKFLSTEEIKACNRLVKKGKLTKGKPLETNATIAYFING